MPQQRDVIRVQYDTPIVIKLDTDAEGKERKGQFGIDYQYTVNDNAGIIWLPRQCRDALLRSRAERGDYVQLLKLKRGRSDLYEVRVVSDARESAASEEEYEQQAPRRTTQRHAPRSLPAAPPPVKPETSTSTDKLRGILDGCFRLSIDTFAEAQTYAASKNMQLAFNEEDVRALAISILIGVQQRMGGR